MVIDACWPVAIDRNVHRTSRWTSSCPAAKLCGVKSVISMLPPRSPKKLATPVLPRRGPYHGAAGLSASADQSVSPRADRVVDLPDELEVSLLARGIGSHELLLYGCLRTTLRRAGTPGISTVQSIFAPSPIRSWPRVRAAWRT